MPAITRSTAAVCAAAAAGTLLTGCLDVEDNPGALPVAVPAATISAKDPAQAAPFAGLTGKQLVHRAEQGMRDSGAMTVETTGRDDTGTLHTKAAITGTGACAIAVTSEGMSFQLIGTGAGSAYLKGNTRFWIVNGGTRVADKLAGKWAKVPASEMSDSGLDEMCDLDSAMDAASADDDDSTFTRQAPTTLDGRPVVPVVQDLDGDTTTLYISTGATPYILKSVDADPDEPETDVFSDFGKVPHIVAPPASLTVDPEDLSGGPGGTLHI